MAIHKIRNKSGQIQLKSRKQTSVDQNIAENSLQAGSIFQFSPQNT